MIDQLIGLVIEKQAETQDTLWLLQTDPAYFQLIAAYWSEYSAGTVSGARMTEQAMKQALGGRVVCYSMEQVREWQEIEHELRNVRSEYITHQKDLKPGRPNPVRYDRALGALLILVINSLINKSAHLSELAYSSPAWKSLWKIVPELSGGRRRALQMKDDSSINFKRLYKDDHILFCLLALGQRPESQGYVRLKQ